MKAIYIGPGKRPPGITLQGLSLQIADTTGAFKLASTTCGTTLLIGKTCEVWLVFDPITAGVSQGVFEASAAASSSSPSLNLIGSGTLQKPAK